MAVGRPVAAVELSTDERSKLEELARRRKTGQAMALRAGIDLACAGGMTNGKLAAKLGVTLPTVGKRRSRFAKDRLAGLADAPRPGQPLKIGDAKVEEVVTRTLGRTLANATH